MLIKNFVESLFLLMGGITLFVYGLKLMSDGMQALVGRKMKKLLGTACRSPVVGMLAGTGVTAVVQSSTATNVMLVGFVNAGALTLRQSLGVVMGANIGTTVTAQLVSLSGSKFFSITAIASVIALAGFITTFLRRGWAGAAGGVLIGFGLIFFGIETMNSTVFTFKDYEFFKRLFMVENPLFLILNGILITGIVQSSSAVSSVVIVLAINGLITLSSSMYLILGMNIGAGVAVLLVSVPLSAEAKKVAVANLLFNVVGMLIWSVVLLTFKDGVIRALSLAGGSVERQIANFHTLFNLSVTLMLLPFVGWMEGLVNAMLKKGGAKRRRHSKGRKRMCA